MPLWSIKLTPECGVHVYHDEDGNAVLEFSIAKGITALAQEVNAPDTQRVAREQS